MQGGGGRAKTQQIFVSESSNKKWRHSWKLSWTLVALETKDGRSTGSIFFDILNWQFQKLYTMIF